MGAAEPALKLANEPEVLESLNSGVAVISRDERLLYCNQTLARWLELRPDAHIGHPVSELDGILRSHFFPAAAANASLRCTGVETSVVTRELGLRTGNETLYLREDSSPYRDAAGNVCGRVFIFHDFSREKEIDRMKSEFISVASHELRTPMTSIKGSIDLVLSGYAGQITGETQELMEIAHKSCDRLIRLINDILDLSKIEAGQVKLNTATLDLTDPVERSLRSVKSYADQFGVTLACVRPGALPPIEGDKDRLEQVVTNLVSNAIKFSPENGEVKVELRADEEWVFCTVIDQGCGIAEQDVAKVFGKFQQVGDGSRKGGTGLGLAIAQGLVHEHGGEIWVESRVKEGSRFAFKLPLKSAAATQS